ncbi:MAG: inositol monophosphatase family protein [Myxococcota bacterium]
MTDRTEELELALEAVRAACVTTRVLQADLQNAGARTKADASPVTVADFAVQALVGRRLGRRFVGEESRAMLEEDAPLREAVLAALRGTSISDEAALLDAVGLGDGRAEGRFWTLDPVDGTKGFLRNAHYCVSLALLEEGRPVLGVLGCPRMSSEPGRIDGDGALLWAVEGQGTHMSDLVGGPTRQLQATIEPGVPIAVAESAESSHTDHGFGDQVLARAGLAARAPVRIDSQVKYAAVAAGEAQVFLRRTGTGYIEKIWDHAAGQMVAEEAGCTVTDLRGRPLDFTKGTQLAGNYGVLTTPAAIHDEVLRAVEGLLAEEGAS